MTTKRFKTKLSKKQKRKNIVVFFLSILFAYIFVLLFSFSIGILDDWTSLETYIIALGLSLFILLMLMFPSSLAAVVLGMQVGKSKRIRDDSTYMVVQNIDYYRENLNDINPAFASLLIDLDLYGHKDIVATLLRMYNKKAICIQKDHINSVKNKNIQSLDNSEIELLNLIKRGKLNSKKALSVWKRNRFMEAERLGYIRKKEVDRRKITAKYIVLFCLSVFFALFLWAIFINLNIFEIETVLEYIIVLKKHIKRL